MGNLRSNFLSILPVPLMRMEARSYLFPRRRPKIPMDGLGHYSAGKAALEMVVRVTSSDSAREGFVSMRYVRG